MRLPVLEGKLIRLRAFKRSDAECLQRYADDPQVLRYVPQMPHPYKIEDAREWINFAHRSARKDQSYAFGIEHLQRREIVGGISLKQIDCQDEATEIGYWLARSFWGQGMASEAVGLILQFCFEILNLHRVYAVAHSTNIGSTRVLEKNGFVREGIFREAGKIGGRRQDMYSYGLLRPEYKRTAKKRR
jgi:RimJ/RimL family protein N-acetyltransferase